MNTKRRKNRKDPLDQLIKAATPEVLGKLIKELALSRPETRRECFEFLKKHVTLTSNNGELNYSSDRKTYARKAAVMAKVRHMWVDVIKTPEKWEDFGRKVKEMNLKRPAFQEEFAKVLPGWKTL